MIKILHLEDLQSDAELVEYELRKANISFQKEVSDNKEDYERYLDNFRPDVILSDHSLPSFNSFMALALLKEKKLDIPFILVTATMSEEFAVDIMKQGAADYILKDRLQRLPSAVINCIEMHKLKAEKRASLERLSFHIENTPLGFIEWDSRGFAKSWSKRAEEIFGWSEKEFIEMQESPFCQVYEKDLPQVSRVLQDILEGKVNSNKIQHRNITKDGSVIWCEWFNSVLKDRDGKVTTMMSMVQDISDQKKLEKQKDNFFLMASHELKTPVTTLKAYGQLAERMLEEKEDADTLNVVQRMGSQVNHLIILIENLLDFTRIQKGKFEYQEKLFDYNELVTQVTADIQKTTNTHEIQYQPGAGAFVFGDRNKISQVLNNLLSNAIKFSPGAKMVLVRTELQDGGVRLSVEDSGIGILPENRQKVFQQFYRITEEKPSTFPGMGIGLYVSSEIIKKQGGKMWLESNVGKGSTFYTWLPLDYRKRNS